MRDTPTCLTPICLVCDHEIVDDSVQDITGDLICSWECQFKLEDECNWAYADESSFDDRVADMIMDEMEVAGHVD